MTTCVRRKPTITYQSPSASDSAFLPRDYGRRRNASSSSSTSSESSLSHTEAKANPTGAKQQSTTITQKTTRGAHTHTRDTTDSLSLFHPLGRLAASLPPFDPRPYGLPLLPERPSASTSTSSSRTQRKSGSQRPSLNQSTINNGVGAGAGKPSTPSKSTTKPTATASPSTAQADTDPNPDVEAKTKPIATQRKSRKRKRVVTEDSDATYPARKTRAPRVASNTTGRRGTSEEDMPPPMPPPTDLPSLMEEAGARVDADASLQTRKSKPVEGSEKPDTAMEMETEPLAATAMDVSPDVAVTAPPVAQEPEKAVAAVDKVEQAPVDPVPPPPAVDEQKPPPPVEEEKEEGELSDSNPQ